MKRCIWSDKVTYPSEEKAKKRLKNSHHRGRPLMDVYKCRNCLGWHLYTLNKNKKKITLWKRSH